MADKTKKENKKGKITAKFVELKSEYAVPDIRIQQGDAYVKQGDNNLYPYQLEMLFKNSGLSSSIIKRKINMLVGNGINYIDNPTEELIMANRYQSLDEVLRKCAGDLEVYGGYYLQIIPGRGDKVAEYYHMPYKNMRVGIPNKFGIVETYYYWPNQMEPIQTWTQIDEFEVFPAFDGKSKKPQIIFIKNEMPGNQYYGSPIYEAALLDIETYMQISNYTNSNLHNNFTPGLTIFFRGPEPDDEQQDEIIKALKDKYKSTDNVGTPMVFFLDSEQEEPKIEAIDTSNIADQFQSALTAIINNIALAHQIPRQLIGLETSGSLGSSKEIFQASQMFRSDYIEPQQQLLLKGFNMVMMYNGDEQLAITNPNPNIMALDMADMLLIFSKNEVRNLFGYEDIEGGDSTTDITDKTKTE